ncbi:endonuclease/exonuclease/phosphatase family protein [Maribellus maritimus]|uniref:endonuclease/exonuclease/phosphatase family protein n=1 Tax=Maribellus maritimus TaxID=2870838 RepID=UPI001EEC1DE6|nr:endonuclease/exonuclease/phosphatase family protein [Maribellus maritimus]MCG6188418.1 endonuclease/exonuclease/phosphatase family protein [Maribellus maritimus]
MKHKLYLSFSVIIFIGFVLFSSCSKEKSENRKNLTIAFYNVENLFDTVDEPGKMDEEFTPGSDKQWTDERYRKKLQDISAVLSSIDKKELPEIIGLCEVENKKVVSDLVHTDKLAAGKYGIVHYESPDVRGIDCALVYRPDEFKVLDCLPVHITFKNEPDYKTRDILYVKGRTKNREVFHLFVNHWPSRIGGEEQTEPKRVAVAAVLRAKIDSVLHVNPKAKIIVMGDMNDEPVNKSLSETLSAGIPGKSNKELVNLMYPDDLQNLGSYNFRGNWNMLDNLIVSTNLLDEEGFQCKDKKGFVFHEEWMEYKNNRGEVSPNRTYGGPNYYGGISDHFPVYFKLQR